LAKNIYNKKENITSGHSVISMKNKAKKAQAARLDENYTEAQRIFDDMEYIFQNDAVDLTQAVPVINAKTFETNKGGRVKSSKLNDLLNKLHSDNAFLLTPKSGYTANSAIEKAIDFNDKIVFNQQGVSTFASYTDVIKSYERLQEMKNAGPGNYLYLFDTETIGGKNKSNIWNPLGITEFAMQKIDLATNEVTKTNIVLGTADTLENKKVVEKILNALGSSLDDSNVSPGSMPTIDPSIIMNDEELRVTAYRYALYGHKDSKFVDLGKGYMEAESLVGDINDWLNPELIKAGYLKNVEAYKASPMTKYGINQAQKTFIDSMSEMYKAANAGTGMIGGQNIVPFDFKTVNTEIARMTKNLQDIVDGKIISDKVSVKNAKEGLKYIRDSFNGQIGFSAPSEQIFDTLPMINFIRETFGIDALFGGNQEAIMAAASGTAKQEHIGAVWFPELFASNEAHRADFDVDVLRNLFTAPIDKLNNKTFIEHFMEVESQGGLKGLKMPAQTIKAGGEQQLLYAKRGTRDRAFGGKGALDHTINKKTGEVFFNSNYEILGPNNKAQFTGNINMGTNINKGNFYYVDSIKKIKAEDLAKDLGDVLPELSGPEVFQVRMRMAGMDDLEYVFHFGSEYELSGWFSSTYDMPAVKNADGKWVLNGDNALDIFEQVEIVDGEVKREAGFYLGDHDAMVKNAIDAKKEKVLTDRMLRDYTDADKQYKRIETQLDIRKALTKAGIEDVTKEEIESILYNNPIEKMSHMNQKQQQELINEIKDIISFTPYGTKEQKVYSNTINKFVTAWDFVSMQDDFYMQVFTDLETYANANNYTKNQRARMFAHVVDNVKSQVANNLYETSEDIRNSVHNTKSFKGSLGEIKNIYDVVLPDGFTIDQPKIKEIQSGINFTSNKDILTVRLGDKSASYTLADQLVKAKFGNINTKQNPEAYKRISMYEFVKHLSETNDFSGNASIAEAMEHMNNDTKKFNIDAVARKVIEAMEDVKRGDPTKGIIKDISIRTLETSQEYIDALNKSGDLIQQAIRTAPVPLDIPLSGKGDMTPDDIIKQYIQKNVLQNYLPSRKEFEKTLVGLNDEQIWQKTLLYNTLEQQITDSLVDITGSLSAIPNSELFIMPDGRFVFKEGNKAATIDSIPKIKLDGNTLYGQVGRSPVQVHLDYGINASGGTYVTTNLGEAYTRNKTVTKSIRKKVKDGTFKIEDVLGITSHLSEKFRQDSRYEFKSGDFYSNFMVGTGQLDTLLPKLFGENVSPEYKAIADEINIPDNVKQVLKDNIGDASKKVKEGGLDPVVKHYLTAYRVEILQGLAKITGDDNIQRLSSKLTIGTKGKGKLEKGKLMGSNMRFETGFANSLDNLGRPVVDGSGNVKFFTKQQILDAAKKTNGLITEGGLFESDFLNLVTQRADDVVGDIGVSWTSRTAYVGERGIRAIIENNMDTVLNNNTIKNLQAGQKENIYNMLKSYVNTFEQQKVFNARAFDSITHGSFAANTIKLSTAKDIINLEKTEELAGKYQRLMDLMGDIEIDPEGVIKYKSSVGKIVKRGDSIIPTAKYGGGVEDWSSKMDRALLNFQVTNKQGIKLTDDQISTILNQNKTKFTGIDLQDKAQILKALKDSLDDYELNFAVEDINRIQLPKILVNDSEKSMNHILYAKTGTINKNVAKVFKDYSDETAELLQGTVLTRQALDAFFSDTQKRRVVAKKAGFKSWGKFVEAWEKEMYTMSDVIFGKGGLFEGFTDIANDNLSGHGNKGTMLVGSLNETINMLGKYSSGGKVENLATRQKGLEEFVKKYNANEEFQFIRNSKNEGILLELKDGHLRLQGGRSLSESLDDADNIDYKNLEKLVKDIDTFIKGQGADKKDWLVHQYEGKELIGRMIYSKDRKGNDIIIGSIGSSEHKLVQDPETQSSMPQEYYDTKLDYLKVKSERTNVENELAKFRKIPTSEMDMDDINKVAELEHKLNKLNIQMDEMDEYLKAMEGTGHSFRIGDQEEKIIKNYFLNQNSYNAIENRVTEGYISKEAVAANEALRGYDIDANEGRKVFGGFLDDLHEQRHYNRYIDSKKLTKNMLENEQYAHLKGVYDDIVGKGKAKQLGLETAQEIYDIRMAELANNFNNLKGDKKQLLDAGFIEMTPDQYLKQFGDPNVPGYESVVKQNVLLKLDMNDGRGAEYVAVPGMGSVLDKGEIRQDWHKHAGRLSSIYQEEFLDAHGAPVETQEAVDKMQTVITELKKSTSEYIKKGTAAHNRARQEVYASVDRVKIMSTMNTADNPLLQHAKVDGKTIAEHVSDGIYYDYSFDSLESFEKRGFFKEDYLKKVGMNREEMIQYLRTEGTIMLDDRYPNIREKSIKPVRHYLAIDDQGMSFIANNAAMMAPHTMLDLNADSDGDSISRFLTKYKGVGYTEYNIARTRAIEAVDAANNFVDDKEREKLIKKATMANMENMGISSRVTGMVYDEYKSQDVKMAQLAMTENITQQQKVIDTWKSDNKKVIKAMSIKQGQDYMQAEVVGGKSVLGYRKLTALSETPTWDEIKLNEGKVNNMLKTIQNNADFFKDKELIQDILDNAPDIASFNKEADVLDKALYAYGMLSMDSGTKISSKGFADMQQEVIKRVRINKLHEEGMQKLGVTATGNVNSTLYGISQAIKSRHGDVQSPLYDELMRSVTSEMSYLLEETPISSKKISSKAGDTKLIEFGKIFRDVEQKGLTEDTRDAMESYFKKYMDHDQIADAYDMTMERLGQTIPENITKEMKVDKMVKDYTTFIGQALDKTGDLYDEVQFYKSFGRGSVKADAMTKAAGKLDVKASNAAEVVFETTGKYTTGTDIPHPKAATSAAENAKHAADNFTLPQTNTKQVSEAIETASNKISKAIMSNGSGLKKSLGLGVVGLAAGLIASGYASGNPLNDPDPATITQKGYEGVKAAPEMMFSSGQGFAPNNTGGYIINIKGDTKHGNRQLKKALKQATRKSIGPSSINMEVKTSQKGGAYSDRDIENMLNNYF
jgi:hypothetical protein